MSLHKEINLEVEICQHLGAHGWLYAEGDAASYDRDVPTRTSTHFCRQARRPAFVDWLLRCPCSTASRAM